MALPGNNHYTRHKVCQQRGLIEELITIGRHIYDLLRSGFDDDIDRKLEDQHTMPIREVCKMFDESSAKLDGLFAKLEGVHDDLSVDIGQIHIDVHVDLPTSARKGFNSLVLLTS